MAIFARDLFSGIFICFIDISRSSGIRIVRAVLTYESHMQTIKKQKPLLEWNAEALVLAFDAKRKTHSLFDYCGIK